MNLNEQDLDLISAFRSGSITLEEKRALIQRLQDDQEFRHAVNEVVETLESLERIRDKAILTSRVRRPAGIKIAPISKLLLAAMVCGVLLIGGVFSWDALTTQPMTLEEKMIDFAKKEFKPYPAILHMQNQTEDPLKNYSKGMYQEAILVWEKTLFPIENAQDSISLFLLSQCYIAVEQPKKAIAILEPMYNQNSKYAPKETGWYLALAYIRDRQLNKAEPLLNKLSKSDLYVSKKAKEALELMRGNR